LLFFEREVRMPWKESSAMEERLRFVARLLDGEPMTDMCREFGISRKTGYKIFDRYKEHGLEALTDRSRRPVRYANQLPQQVESMIVSLKRDKPHWGARKIRELLVRRLAGDVRVPAKSTIHTVLDRRGLVKRQGRSRNRATGTLLSVGTAPNDLWCSDFKGEFRLGNRQYCYPLTVTDHASRFLLMCEALESVRENTAFTAFERLFQERGLPTAIRSDNGVPFASPNGLFNLSKLAVWWLRLGITIERIKPGNPQQNGRHERMHLTLKEEATRPPGMNSLQQQARFDAFVHEFNNERPHQALAMKCPAEVYAPSPRPYQGLPEITYPFHDRDILVTTCGRICMHRKKINISTVLAGQRLGIKEVDEGIWLVSFMQYDLGYIDLEQKTLQPLDNPFGPGVSPMS
jgi:transposase InsO family protein